MISRVLTLVSALVLHEVSGHGTMSFPVTRNVAISHSCPTCANGPSVCGSGNGGQWQAPDADATATNSPYTTPLTNLVAGGMVETEAYFSACHQGHAVIELCANPGPTITEDCFVRLERDPTDTRFAPYSDVAPDHIFFPDNNCAGTFNLAHPMRVRVKIPETAISEHAVLRWQWQTGNSCDSSPYNTQKSNIPEIATWTNEINGRTCKAALSGGWTSCGENCPGPQCGSEQFRTCADVKIVAGDASTVITSGNAQTDVPNGSADAGGSDQPHVPATTPAPHWTSPQPAPHWTPPRPAPHWTPPHQTPQAQTTAAAGGASADDVAECVSRIKGTAEQWDSYCQDRCAEYSVPGSFGQAWCAAAGYGNLYECVAAHQAACQ